MNQEKEIQEKYENEVKKSCEKLSNELQSICDDFVKAMVELNKAAKK